MERDGVNGPRVHEQHCNLLGVNHRVAGGPVQPGVDSGLFPDEQAVTEQSPLLKQVVNNIPGEIHQFTDRRLHR